MVTGGMKNTLALLLVLVPCFASSQPNMAANATCALRELYKRAYYSSVVPSIEETKGLIASGADVNCAIPLAHSCPLHVAVLRNLPDHVQVLLNAPNIEVDKECGFPHKFTPLYHALHGEGDFRDVGRMLLEVGANADARFLAFVSEPNWPAIYRSITSPTKLVTVTPLLNAVLKKPQWIPVLAPYVQVDTVSEHSLLGRTVRVTELAMAVLLRCEFAIRYLLAEGASVDKLCDNHKQLMLEILERGSRAKGNAEEDPIKATAVMRRHETLKDIERLKQYLSRFPANLAQEALENIDHALLNAVRNDLEEAALLLYRAGAAPELVLKWLKLHHSELSPVQRRLLDTLQPSRILTALHKESSSWISLLPTDIIGLIVPLLFGRAPLVPSAPSSPTAASAAL